MHEFNLVLIGSINTFILHHYFLRRMLLVATPLNVWLLQLNKFQISLLLVLGKLKSMRLQLQGNHFHIFVARKLTFCITIYTKFLRSPTLKI